MDNRITIAVDARPLTRGKGGIQRYLQRVLELIGTSDEILLILYCDEEAPAGNFKSMPMVKIRRLGGSKTSKLLWHVYSCFWAFKDKPNIFWSPRHHLPIFLPKATKKLVTIHDLVWKSHPETLPRSKLLMESILMPRAIAAADKIICVSNTTQHQLTSFYPRAKNICEVIHNGFDIPSKREQNTGSKEPFYLAVGTLEPRKNYEMLIAGFDHYADIGGVRNLVIVGKKGWSFKSIYLAQKHAKHKNRITIKSDVDDASLDELYRTSAGFISTSYDEGFGLPAIEAHVRGCPLLLTDIPVYRELFPFAKCWLDTSSKKNLGQQLLGSELNNLSQHRFEKPQFKHHSWQKCADQHLDLILGLNDAITNC